MLLTGRFEHGLRILPGLTTRTIRCSPRVGDSSNGVGLKTKPAVDQLLVLPPSARHQFGFLAATDRFTDKARQPLPLGSLN